jgi:predicted GNAT superfamily acetyltransferase
MTRDAPVDHGVVDADQGAQAAGVQIRELVERTEFEELCGLFDEIWRPPPTKRPVTTELLRALTKAGNYVAGAYDSGALLGGSVGFFGPPADAAIHSHIAGVSVAGRGRSVGFALKLHQRAWALERGVEQVAWTFDPLIRRNAHFNLTKLAASAADYLPNFYGGMSDGINAGDQSDRLLVRWNLASAQARAACDGRPMRVDAASLRARGAAVALDRGPRGDPVHGASDTEVVLVAVPADAEALRAADPELAGEWRLAVREVLGGLLDTGARITGFDQDGWYVVSRPSDEDRGTHGRTI